MLKFMNEHLKYTSGMFVAKWQDHEKAIKRSPLVYLDHLLDAIAAEYGRDPVTLAKQLYAMVPEMHYGTARRLVRLKFGDQPAFASSTVVTTTFLEH